MQSTTKKNTPTVTYSKNMTKTSDQSKELIDQIDNFIETKPVSKTTLTDLIDYRNACAVNIMNAIRINQKYRANI